MLDILKWAVYLWTIFEVGLLSSLYWFAYKKMSQSRIISGLAMFLTALTLLVLYRLVLSYSIILTKDAHSVLRDLLILPMIGVSVTARIFRKRSIDLGTEELKDELNDV